ncbi:MAG: penicillin-binding protein 2 [Acidimicrobiales bacterium]|jgi:penicillin-binding protein 2
MVRLNVLGVVVAGLLAVMVLRLWTLQVIQHATLATTVNADTLRTVSVPAPRGLIVGRNDTELASNQVEQEIVLSRSEAALHPSVVGAVAALVGKTPTQIKAALADSQYSLYQPVPVMVNAPVATVLYVEEHQAEFPGVSVEQVTQRSYPQGTATSTPFTHVLGYVGAITAKELAAHPHQGYTQGSQIGTTGLEQEYQSYLRGTPGTEELEVNRLGTVVGVAKRTKPVQGDTVVTHLDLGLEKTAEAALKSDILRDRKTIDPLNGKYPTANSGALVVMDVRTGAVLAMASYPTYNLNEWIGGISTANYAAIQAVGAEPNYAIQGVYTPGSSFKLASATAALQRGLISPYVPYHDTGTFTIPGCTGNGCTLHDDTPSDAGQIRMPLALAESDDDYFYNIGYQFWIKRATYGLTPIQNTAAQYGLGQLTGIDLPGEIAGQVDSPQLRIKLHKEYPASYPNAGWYVGDNLEMAFGQGETLLTPIEMADAYATFANGGTRYQPQVAAAIVTPSGKVVKRMAPKVTGHVSLPSSIYTPMLQGFEGAVYNPKGTAYYTYLQYAHFSPSQFMIAGKTGTASVSVGATTQPDAWFVGFGPIPNPQYVVVCVVGHGGYGDAAAAPAVMNVFNYLVTNPISSPVQLPTANHPPTVTPPKTNPPANGTP